MNRARYIVVVFLVMVALVAAGCGQKNPLQPVSQATPPPAPPAAPPPAAPSIPAPQPPQVTPAAPPPAAPSIPAPQLPAVTPAAPPGPQQPTPAAEPTPSLVPQPAPADPRTAQIKTALQNQGFQVLDVSFIPAREGKRPILGAIVDANYAQPSGEVVLRQAYAVWDVLIHSITIDSPEGSQMVLVVGERWTKYVMYLSLKVEDVVTYMKSVEAAGSDEQKQQALGLLQQSISFGVFDEERKQWVDQKDFMNKNFTGG